MVSKESHLRLSLDFDFIHRRLIQLASIRFKGSIFSPRDFCHSSGSCALEGDLFGTSSNSAQHQDSTPAAASNRDRNEPRTIVLSPPNLEDTDSEEDEDDDLFTIKPKRTLTVSNKDNEPASNAAGISEAPSSQEPVTSRNETASSVMEQPPPIQSNANLGSDSDSDEDDLFKSFRKVRQSGVF